MRNGRAKRAGRRQDRWEGVGMKKPELTRLGWLGPREAIDRASHHFGKCSECDEIICVEKAVATSRNTEPETKKILSNRMRKNSI